jgi:hypothetical protein
MQVYVHLAGKNHGPYSVDQLRQYVQAGSFRDDHLACYDATNWVKIKDVPGFAVEVKKAKPVQQKLQQKAPQKTKKMRTKKFLVVSLGVIVALLVVGGSVAGVSYYLIGDDDEPLLLPLKTFLRCHRIRLSRYTTVILSKSIYQLSIRCLAMIFLFVCLVSIRLN